MKISFPSNGKQLGPWQLDLFVDKVNAQKRQYFSWKPPLGAVKMDAFTVKWQEIQGYAFPIFCLIGRCLNQTGAGNISPHDTNVAKAIMVCGVDPDANRRTNSDSLHGGSSNITSRRATSTITDRQSEYSSLKSFWFSADGSQISEQSRNLLNKNIRDGTESTYKTLE